ncbi:ABC transporter permease [Acetobacter oeni]|uniref:Sugar ABC transporter permease n=1 Tax=Acetobacter oeni TaxID=304077 RepID=A0A511XPZ1_9PROT|nr:ABC transporter permease [Acetobacter oeni]MBB3883646.1 lipopolysaccharide transport system permease protein [Acetobacter oeni]GBR09966.1 polysaccharide/O-antigen exporter permease [Acetobacter oeni LMG 21952]GEN64984.1 sugar ABC transporter permease [Acetobacter oeni]
MNTSIGQTVISDGREASAAAAVLPEAEAENAAIGHNMGPSGDEDEPVIYRSRVILAFEDIIEGARLWRLAVSLGWLDIRLQFRGSTVGPLWLTLGTAVMIGSMGMIYGRLFHLVLRDYLPYLSISMILWQVGLAGVMQDACTCFTSAANSIRSTRLPFSLQAFRTLVRSAVTFSYNIVVPIAVYAIFGLLPGPEAFLAVPGLMIWAINAFALCLLFGSIGARYRDIPPIVASGIQVAFYVTPIIWNAHQLGKRGNWLILNPFYSLLEIVREPLTGQAPRLEMWIVALSISVGLWILSLMVFSRSRARLAFWI